MVISKWQQLVIAPTTVSLTFPFETEEPEVGTGNRAFFLLTAASSFASLPVESSAAPISFSQGPSF
jgi:hypothetical protein